MVGIKEGDVVTREVKILRSDSFGNDAVKKINLRDWVRGPKKRKRGTTYLMIYLDQYLP